MEGRLLANLASIMRPGSPIYVGSLFVFGAANRTLAQSKGFRSMIEARNFPSAAILLRTQVDTAMRVNGLKYLDSPETQLGELLKGHKTFRDLVSWKKTENGRAIRMHDSFLLERLEDDEPWIKRIYKETSDFVHLSFRHFFIGAQVEDQRENNLAFCISGEDISREEASYFEICDAFFDVSALTSNLLLGKLTASRNSQP